MTDEDDLKKLIKINDIIHEPVRLAIMLFLFPRPNATFPEIKTALDLTSGNLSSHLKKLEKSKYVEITKTFVDLKPTTVVSLTLHGRNAVMEYSTLLKTQLDRTKL